MVKLAVLSDIHANWYALESVITSEKFIGCEYCLFCGDAIGYYYQVDQVIDYLRLNVKYAVIGNHGRLFLKNSNKLRESYKEKYGSGLEKALNISDTNYEWLVNLPKFLNMNINGKTIYLTHGSPLLGNGYVYPDSKNETIEAIFDLNFNIILFGHSHYQFVFQKNNQIIVNPGAVGQPRDKGGYAGWAIMDIQEKIVNVEFQRNEYDVSKLLNDVNSIDPNNEYLSNILVRK